jgi:hypothetical protein
MVFRYWFLRVLIMHVKQAWYTQNLQIAIPATIAAAILLLSVLWILVAGSYPITSTTGNMIDVCHCPQLLGIAAKETGEPRSGNSTCVIKRKYKVMTADLRSRRWRVYPGMSCKVSCMDHRKLTLS